MTPNDYMRKAARALTSADLGRALNRVERARLLADYTGEETDAETARHAVDEASRFILAIRTRFNFPE